jgi:hypothetical protein
LWLLIYVQMTTVVLHHESASSALQLACAAMALACGLVALNGSGCFKTFAITDSIHCTDHINKYKVRLYLLHGRVGLVSPSCPAR